MNEITINIHADDIRRALTQALVATDPHGRSDSPLSRIAKAVIGQRAAEIEKCINDATSLVINDRDFQAQLQVVFRKSIEQAVTDKARSIMRGMTQETILKLVKVTPCA